MKISLNWLRELVSLPAEIGWQEIADRLTHSGTKVEGAVHVGAGLSGVVVAEVRGKGPHPRADKLTLVEVFDGQAVIQVVCGAPNVPAPGARVAWARPGARLPNGTTLSAREVRGVLSPGMLCAEDELGLSADHAGILVMSPADGLAIGADFAQAAGLPDVVLDLEITANRPDCLGHVGVAREVAALFRDHGARPSPPAPLQQTGEGGRSAIRLPSPEGRGVGGEGAEIAIAIHDPDGCPRYTGRVITGVRIGPSPLPLRLRLQRLGVRAISNVVDATNLALLEWGQPLHAFDLHHIRGRRIVVRKAHPGEILTTLDGQERPLHPEDLVIADAERGLAVAGVMGGQDSEVTDTSTDLLLESAYFNPTRVRRTARRLRLHTEASHRFERGVDPNDGVVMASQRCARLIAELGGGTIREPLHDVYPRRIGPLTLALRPGRARMLLGTEIADEEQARLLFALSLSVAREGPPPHAAPAAAPVLSVTVPTFRPDLTREVDLIEEIGRLWGYDRVAPRLPALRMGIEPPIEEVAGRIADRARDLCCALGLDEVQTYSLVPPQRLKLLGFAAGDRRAAPLLLQNPLREELSALKTQLVAGLLEALRHNLSHGLRDVRIFEVAEVFLPLDSGQPEERARVGGILSGTRDHWLKGQAADELDLYDVRGIVAELVDGLGLGQTGIRPARSGEAPWLHPGVSALVTDGDQVIGEFGEVHPDLLQALQIEARAFAFELDLPQREPPLAQYTPLPRFPAVDRDLSFFVGAQVPAAGLLAALRGAGEPLLLDVRVLEDYREPGRVPEGRKGMLLGLTYRAPDRTLTDEEVQKAHERVVHHLQQQHAIELR